MKPASAEPATGECGGGSRIEHLLPLVYDELKIVARRERRRMLAGDTLSTTALVHEVYLRLATHPAFASQADFLRIMAVAMRRALIDHLRGQLTLKRGAGERVAQVDDVFDLAQDEGTTALRVNDALAELASISPRLVAVVECRFFAGFSEAETATALRVSERTVQREWAMARTWLKTELGR